MPWLTQTNLNYTLHPIADSDRRSRLISLTVSLLIISLWPNLCAAQSPTTQLRFADISQECGITWEHTTGRSKRGYIVEGIASGLASFDYDQDGRIDVYFLSGHPLGQPAADPGPLDGFFRNLGEMQFEDVTLLTRIDGSGYGLGVCAADYDGDGFKDLFLNNFGRNYLYLNCGDGTFMDASHLAGVHQAEKVAGGVAFADLNGDQLIDLYVGNYVDFTVENSVYIERNGQVYHAGPRYYRSEVDELFLNNGDGTFRPATNESGISEVAGPSMGLIAADLNLDGHVDVYVGNDAKPNFFFVSDGMGKFTEDGILAGLAFDFRGTSNASMGVDLGDFDGDGLQDLIVTNYQNEMPVLYKNLGDGLFQDVTTIARLPEVLQPHVTWGCGLFDLDNDGHLDLYIGCGHFDDAENIDDRTANKVRDFVLLNTGGRFRDVSQEVGLSAVESSRGVAFDDFDNDGDTDVIVLNSNARPTVLRNDLPPGANWIQLELVGSGYNRGAVNALVELTYAGQTQFRQAICGRGYQSSYGDRMHFGLASPTQVPQAQVPEKRPEAQVVVKWPDGQQESFTVTVDSCHILRQGSGRTK